MDVQGSQYHLVDGIDDWGRCVDSPSGRRLSEAWADGQPAAGVAWEYDPGLAALRLRHRDTARLHRAVRTPRLDPNARRGAGQANDGTFYWIDADSRTIRYRTASGGAARWWSSDEPTNGYACRTGTAGEFGHAGECPSEELALHGLTVTTRQFLLVGYRSLVETTDAGLLIFDLPAGDGPLRMRWPDHVSITTSDLADTADGGALVLDAERSGYWRLDRDFRLHGQQSDPPEPFGLRDAASAPLRPVSIEPGPDDGVLVLDADPDRGHSTLYRFDGSRLRWATPLVDVIAVADPRDPTIPTTEYSLLGHDFCYVAGPPGTCPLPPPALYVGDAEGQQVVAFALDADTGEVRAFDAFLPMRPWAGRALVRAGRTVWSDSGERWIPLEVFNDRRFDPTATLVTPIEVFGAIAGDMFDSQTPGCVWHRLFLDAQVPNGTSVAIRARAADDPRLLSQASWLPQPTPYVRSGGAELPWSDVWADRRAPDATLPPGAGTWELLFQQVAGRYLQLEITIAGNGRSSPLLRSMRAWFPRFSYPEHYLPAVFARSDGPDQFLERFLANVEGLYTGIEERIEHTHLLLDARTTPDADLPWLAAWFGLALDPLWDTDRSRFLVRHVDRFYRTRGTVAGLVATLRTYVDPVLDERVFDPPDPLAQAAVRVLESFPLRVVSQCPTSVPDDDLEARARRAAHRFDVLLPARPSAEEAAMVFRIVAAAKPAHTAFRVHFHQFDVPDRIVSDRDRIGALPAL